MRKILISLIALVGVSLSARAQFFTWGSDPGNLHWYSLESPY